MTTPAVLHRSSPAVTLAALLAGLFALAACDRGPATVTPYMHANGSLDFLAAATRNGGPLYLEIAGDPFGSGEVPEDSLAPDMESAVQNRVLRLTTDSQAAEDPDFRLVLVFNPADSGEVLGFCRHQPPGGPPKAAERVELRAGFCRNETLLAAVDGWVEEAKGPDDPRFKQLMQQVMRDIFARRRSDD